MPETPVEAPGARRPGLARGPQLKPILIAALGLVILGLLVFAGVRAVDQGKVVASGYPLGYRLGYQWKVNENRDLVTVLVDCRLSWSLAPSRHPLWEEERFVEGCQDGFFDARFGRRARWHDGNLPDYDERAFVSVDAGSSILSTTPPDTSAESTPTSAPTAPPSPTIIPGDRNDDGLELSAVFDDLLEAMRREGETGLLSYLADPSSGDLWGISNHTWLDPECSEGLDGSGGCVAFFEKDGMLVENVFVFEQTRGTWYLTDSYVWN